MKTPPSSMSGFQGCPEHSDPDIRWIGGLRKSMDIRSEGFRARPRNGRECGTASLSSRSKIPFSGLLNV